MFPVSIFMVNYFNLYSYSSDLVTVEILHQRGIYCNILWPPFLALCLHAARHFLNNKRTGICILVHTAQWANQGQGPFYGSGRKLNYPFKKHWRLKGAWSKTVQRSMWKYQFLEILSFQWLPWECQGLSKLLLLNTCTFNQVYVLLITLSWPEFSTQYKNW